VPGRFSEEVLEEPLHRSELPSQEVYRQTFFKSFMHSRQ
jgi:hypothetical protein